MAHTHIMTVCPEHATVLRQCRCMAAEKPVTYGVCHGDAPGSVCASQGRTAASRIREARRLAESCADPYNGYADYDTFREIADLLEGL